MLSVVCCCLLLSTDTKINTWYDEIGQCAQNGDTLQLGSLVDITKRAYVII